MTSSPPMRCLQLHHHTQFIPTSTRKPSFTRRTQVQVVIKAEQQNEAISRRSCAANILITWLPAVTLISASPASAEARLRRNRKAIPLEDYKTTPDGLKYYDLVEGRGPVATKGSTVQVHFECLYRGITAVSSRESKILAGNRIISQPYTFTVGAPPGKERKREFVDSANGLFSAQAAPKPPRAMYSLTEGMKVGGKRTVIVTPEAGYGSKGMNEIPPGATFELNLELLQPDSGSNRIHSQVELYKSRASPADFPSSRFSTALTRIRLWRRNRDGIEFLHNPAQRSSL